MEDFAISIHALLAESDLLMYSNVSMWVIISIHALLAESDTGRVLQDMDLLISIHALLAESDTPQIHFPSLDFYFYPRSPCGERQPVKVRVVFPCGFLSTLSLRRATVGWRCYVRSGLISIHALLAESDLLLLVHSLTP